MNRGEKLKILIVGGSGLTGSVLAEMAVKYFDVYATYLSNPLTIKNCKFFSLDITKSEDVLQLIKKISPDVVVHTVGIPGVDFCETHPDETWRIHVEGTRNIAEGCRNIGSKLIYMSTDYVFDGEKGGYSEDDEPRPISVYARTKLEAERIVQSFGIPYAIVRPAVIYGWHPKSRFLNWILGKLVKNEKVPAFADQYSCPTLVYNLAEAILKLAETENIGIYHTVGSSCVNRFEFARKTAEIFGFDESLIEPVSSESVKQAAKRPKMLCLDNSKVQKDLRVKFLGIEDGLVETKGRASFEYTDLLKKLGG